jgi:uncharacterized protein with PIN domain
MEKEKEDWIEEIEKKERCPKCKGKLKFLKKRYSGYKDIEGNPFYDLYFSCKKCGEGWVLTPNNVWFHWSCL